MQSIDPVLDLLHACQVSVVAELAVSVLHTFKHVNPGVLGNPVAEMNIGASFVGNVASLQVGSVGVVDLSRGALLEVDQVNGGPEVLQAHNHFVMGKSHNETISR